MVLAAACGKQNNGDGTRDAGRDVVELDVADRPDLDADGPGPEDLPDSGTGSIIGSKVPTPVQEGVSPDGADDVDAVLSDEARAGRIDGETGFTGIWSHCKSGDFKLYNGVVEACISAQSSRYEMFGGGALVDVRTVGNPADDVFDLYAPRVGFNTVHPETVEVIRDGSDGGAAVIRLTGTDMPAAYFVGVIGTSGFRPYGLSVTVEYRLGPGDDFLEAVTFIRNETENRAQTRRGSLLALGDRARQFRPGTGFGDPSNTPFEWLAAAGEGHSFAWVVDEPVGSLTGALDAPWEFTQRLEPDDLRPGESVVHIGRLVIGDGSLDEVVRRARELLVRPTGEPREITIVDDSGGAPVVGRTVEVHDENDEAVTGGVTDADGKVTLHLRDGEHRFLVDGVLGAGGLDVRRDVTGDAVELAVPATGTIRVEATADGAPTVASVDTSGNGRFEGATHEGAVEFQVIPGEFTVTVGKGPEYDRVTTPVTAVAGETATVQVNLTRELDTTDWISADFHQHMEPSSDSTVNVEDRLLDNVAQGVELVAPTDHDVVTDLVPYIAELGLDDVVSTFPGVELSPALAHTNVYPVPFEETEPGRGAIPLAALEDGEPRRRSVVELIADARQMPTDPVVQVNHPRDSSGLFDLVEFDPEAGPDAVEHNWWTTDFDAIEIPNGDECLQYRDWSGLWNAGLTPTAIGSSDSHGLWADAGSDRTWLYLPAVQPGNVDAFDARDAVRDGRVSVASDAFIDFTDSTLPGDELVQMDAEPVQFALRVQSPSWASIDRLQVVVNGEIVETIPVTSVSEVLDFDQTVSVAEANDFWVSFFAAGPSGNYAFTNPVRVDRDGGGFSAPGPRQLSLDGLAFCD